MPRSRSPGDDGVVVSRRLVEDLRQFLFALADRPAAVRAVERSLDCEDLFAYLLGQLAALGGDGPARVDTSGAPGLHQGTDGARWLVGGDGVRVLGVRRVGGREIYEVDFHGEVRHVAVPPRV